METETESETETERQAYIMLRGEKVLIEEIHTWESQTFDFCHGGSYNGEMPIKIKSPCLEKAMEFCEKRGQLRGNPAHILDAFDHDFLKEVRESEEIDVVDLYHAAGRLGIPNLFNLLFKDVVRILCEEETTPLQLEKIFKVRYNEVTSPKIMELLDLAPPCPILSEEQQEEMKLKDNRAEILKVSPADFTTLPLHHKMLMMLGDPDRGGSHGKQDNWWLMPADDDDDENKENNSRS